MRRQEALALIAALVILACVGLLLSRRHASGAACLTPHAEACGGSVAALYEVRGANPCAIVRARIGEYHTAFCIDTGFAGPCLLSLPCLARAPPLPPNAADVVAWAGRAQPLIATARASESEQSAALHAFTVQNRCSDFTSGCTMRLASIGATKESTSDMLLAPPLELATPGEAGKGAPTGWTAPRACSGQPVAEVLSSTHMPTMHLLTCDWLVQNSPSLLAPHAGTLTTNMTADQFAAERPTLHAIGNEMSGGAFVATLRVGGVPLRVTVDSGAACYLSIGKQASTKLRACRPTGQTMRQVGANGERICAHAVRVRVEMCGVAEDVPVLVNDLALDSEDGYVGWCFLRHFDMCITPDTLYARRNSAPFDTTLLGEALSTTPCAGPPPECTGPADASG